MWNRVVVVCAAVASFAAAGCGKPNSNASAPDPGSPESACTACHAFPPAAPHPVLASPYTRSTCAACHPETVNPDGTIDTAGGKHANGRVDGFSGHPAGWMDPRYPTFHGTAAAADATGCRKCHAVTPPASVTRVTCAGCHPAAGDGDWTISCSSCHGSSLSAAPPKDLSGNVATTARGVGAHQSHLQATRGFAAPLACASCHFVPESTSEPGHVDGSVQVTGYTGSDPALAAAVRSPGWSAGSASCATSYCHGASPLLGGGSVPVPQWTKVDGSQAFCGSCHGLPPTGHTALAAGAGAATCAVCHPETVKADGTIDVSGGRHVNGRPDGFQGHPEGWLLPSSPSFHGPPARAGLAGCRTCHAVSGPATVSAITCSSCHAGAGDGIWTVACNSCHGSAANAAPPKDLSGNTATTARGVGAHQSHLAGTGRFAGPVACASCHAVPAAASAPGHGDGTVQVTGYTGSDAALAAAVTSPGWDAGSASCGTSYCHGASPMLGGGTVQYPTWTKVDGSQVYCGSCHGLPPTGHDALAPGSTAATCSVCHPETVNPDGTIDVAGGRHVNGRTDGFQGHGSDWWSGQVHGPAAAQDLQGCFVCHSPEAPGRVLALTCSTCHGKGWTTTCRGCHGTAANPAPPKDLRGNTSTTARGVGAHQSHVTGTHGIAAPLDCVHCHAKPATTLASGHIDGTVQVTGYTGTDPNLAARITTQNWDGTALTCSTYCHGSTLGGGSASQPVWTRVDGSQVVCGSCHGLPPTRHMTLTPPVTAATCAGCHPATVRPDGTIDVAGGKHLNGTVEAAGFEGHGAGWLVPGDPAFHGYAATSSGTSYCFGCHSPREPSPNGIRTCASCHDAMAGGGDWTTSCIGCHGASDTPAPPRDVHGNTTTTAVGVGAHRSHVEGTHGIAAPLDCVSCHEKPAGVFSAGHLDGSTRVTGYTGTDPSLRVKVTDPGWNRAGASCATSYCHGATFDGGTASQPVWTRVDGSQAACGSCHGLPPARHIALTPPVTAATCAGCHPGTVRADGTIDVAGGKHLNGVIDAEGFAGHGAGWLVPGDPAFHGQAAISNGMNYCFGCHSPKEPSTNGIRTCASCHDALAGGGDWTTSCIGCHGGSDTPAPPKDVHGNTATTAIGVGAHRSHVEATHGLAQRYDCSACHVKPALVFSDGHLDGSTRVTGYTGSDPSLAFVGDPAWNRASATCSTSWCHGSYSGTFNYTFPDGNGSPEARSFNYAGKAASPTWTVVDGTQGACGTCHGVPPRPNGYWHSGVHGGAYNGCDLCHPGVRADGSGFVDPSRHVNGSVDVTPRWGSRCFNCH